MGRIKSFDLIRAIAIILVVLTHATERGGFFSDGYRSMMYNIHRMGVPLFIMLSGALIIPRATNITEYYKKYLPRIIQFVVLIFIYSFLSNMVANCALHDMHVMDAIKKALISQNGITCGGAGFITRQPGPGAGIQLWYMYMIIGIYLVAPYIAALIKILTIKQLVVLVAICSMSVWPIGFIAKIAPCSVYVAYFIAGYLIYNNSLRSYPKWIYFILCCSILLIWGLVTLHDVFTGFSGSLHWYASSSSIFASSVLLYFLLVRIQKSNFVIDSISRCSFGIFLIHYIVIYLLMHFFPSKEGTFNIIINTGIYFVGSFFFSWLISWLLMKNVYLKKLAS